MTCWPCAIFDKLFLVISQAAALAYERLTAFGVIIFCILFAFYLANVVWENIKDGGKDSLFQKTLKSVIIKSLVVFAILAMGITFPKIISKITFEPVAHVTLLATETILPSDYKVESNYQPITLDNSGFFNPQLRDTILQLMQAGMTQYQVFIKMGLGVMDGAFTTDHLFSIGSLIKHIILFFIGLFIVYKFMVLFIKYSFCFMDVIVAMALFAFFFPLSLILFIFKDANKLPGWMKNLGGDLGAGQIKHIINAIVGIISAILTYSIILLIVRGYFSGNGIDPNSIQTPSAEFFDFDIENSNYMQLTFAGAIVLIYVIEYLAGQIPQITTKILSVFGVKPEDSVAKEMGDDVFNMTNVVFREAKKVVTTIVNPDKVIAENEKKDEGKSDKGDKTK